MGEFIEIEFWEPKVGSLVDQSSIFGPDPNDVCDAKIGATAIDERAARLSFRSAHGVSVRWIEGYRPTSTEDVRLNASVSRRNVNYK